MSRRSFRIQPGKGGLRGEAARVKRAASGANNRAIYGWMVDRKITHGSTGGAPGSLLINGGGGDSFEGYQVQSPFVAEVLDNGNAFSGNWVDKPNFIGTQAIETFEIGYPLGGFGFTGSWTDKENFTGLSALDNAESYADGANVAGLTGGTGWSGAWDV